MTTRRRRWWRVALVALLIVVAAGLGIAAPGRYQALSQASLRTAHGRADAPAWTRPCWPRPDYGHSSCVRVSGRVVWIERNDADGDGDRHVVLMSRFKPRIVKFKRGVGHPLPGLLSHYEATGVTKRGGSGHIEIELAP